MVHGNGAQHHVNSGGAARTSQAPSANFKQRLRHGNLWKSFTKRIYNLPMHGDAATLQQSGARQQEATCVHGTQGCAIGVKAMQPGFQGAGVIPVRLYVRTQNDSAQGLFVCNAGMGLNQNAIVISNRISIH